MIVALIVKDQLTEAVIMFPAASLTLPIVAVYVTPATSGALGVKGRPMGTVGVADPGLHRLVIGALEHEVAGRDRGRTTDSLNVAVTVVLLTTPVAPDAVCD